MRFFKICYNELADIFSDAGIVLFMIVVPLFYPLLYAYVYDGEVIRDTKVVVVDESHSMMSRDFCRRVDASPDLKIVSHCLNMDEAKGMIERAEAYGIILIPRDFAYKIARGEQATIGVYCEMSAMMNYKGLLLTCAEVSQQMNKEIKVSKLGSSTDKQAEITAAPIDYETISLYNPQNGYSSFLIPPVLMLILQQTLMLGIGMHMGRTREMNAGSLIPHNKLYKNPIEITFGKILSYSIIFIVMLVFMRAVVCPIFGLPQLSNLWTYLAWGVPFIIDCVVYSMFFSYFVYRREDCIMLFVFLSVPLLFLSGVSWPLPMISNGWKLVSYIFPSTMGVHAFVMTNSMGASLSDISFYLEGILIQTCVYMVLVLVVYYISIIRLKNKYSAKSWKKYILGI